MIFSAAFSFNLKFNMALSDRFILFLGISTVLATGASQGQDAPAVIDIGSAEAPIVSSTVVPIPMEIFCALDKFGSHDWGRMVDDRVVEAGPDRGHTALLFGLVISQGFVAVQAEDKQEVMRLGQSVQRLAKLLGVGDAVDGRLKIISESLRDGSWDAVKQEFDRTRQTVLDTMAGMRDRELTTLVALGGWLGGTEVVAEILSADYSAEASDLLNQTGLLGQLIADFQQLPESIRQAELFAEVGTTLAKCQTLMVADASGHISQLNVQEIHRAANALTEAIYSN